LARKPSSGSKKKSTSSAKGAAKPAGGGSPRQKALKLVEQAASSFDDEEFAALIDKALVIDPACPEAWQLRASRAPHPAVAFADFAKAIEISEQRLGQGQPLTADSPALHSDEGNGLLTALVLASTHANSWGRHEKSLRYLNRIVELFPDQADGTGDTMMVNLLETGRYADAQAIGEKNSEKVTLPLSLRTLAQFAVTGDSPESQALLKSLRSANKYLIDLLIEDSAEEFLGEGSLSEMFEGGPTPGSKEEAAMVCEITIRAWWSVPGAITWLTDRRTLARKSPHAPSVGPTPANIERLEGLLPAPGSLWELGVTRMPNWIKEGKHEIVRPWHVTILDPDSGICLDHDLRQRLPDVPFLFDRILKAATRPMGGVAGKPSVISVRRGSVPEELAEPLDQAGIELRFVDEPLQLDFANESLRTAIVREANLPSLAEMPGVDEARIRRWFEAACRFTASRAWVRIGDLPIRVSSSKLSSGPWTLSTFGKDGAYRSLVLTDVNEDAESPFDFDEEDLMAAMSSGQSPEKFLENFLKEREGKPFPAALKVEFFPQFGLFPADLVTFEGLGLVPFAPESWPCAGLSRGDKHERSLLTWELDLFEGLFQSLPAFLAARPNYNAGEPWATEVETAGGPLPLQIEWADVTSSCGF
jgi:tetratricopeptide (TPR) repeat protein